LIYILEPRFPTETRARFQWKGRTVVLCGPGAFREKMESDPDDTLNYDRDRLIQEQQE
jgi:hypothetical protein